MYDYCNICGAGHSEHPNEIVFCEGFGCNVAVHQECYGVLQLPDADVPWYCHVCLEKQRLQACCDICQQRDGPMKRSVEGKWIHLERIGGISDRRFETRGQHCQYNKCKHPDRGYCLTCTATDCSVHFHPLCQRRANLPLELSPHATPIRAYCPEHRDLGMELVPEQMSSPKASSPTKQVIQENPIALGLHRFWQEEINPYFERPPEFFDLLREHQLQDLGTEAAPNRTALDVTAESIVPFGQHYTVTWAQEDAQQGNGAAASPSLIRKRSRSSITTHSRQINSQSLREGREALSCQGTIEYDVRSTKRSSELSRNLQEYQYFCPYLVMRCHVQEDPSIDPNVQCSIEDIEPSRSDFLMYEHEYSHQVEQTSESSEEEFNAPVPNAALCWINAHDLKVDGQLHLQKDIQVVEEQEQDNAIARDLRLLELKSAALDAALHRKCIRFQHLLQQSLSSRIEQETQSHENDLVEQNYREQYLLVSSQDSPVIHDEAQEGEEVASERGLDITRQAVYAEADMLLEYALHPGVLPLPLEADDPANTSTRIAQECMEYLLFQLTAENALTHDKPNVK